MHDPTDQISTCPLCGDDTYEVKSGPVQVVTDPQPWDKRNIRIDLSCGCTVRDQETYFPETGWI